MQFKNIYLYLKAWVKGLGSNMRLPNSPIPGERVNGNVIDNESDSRALNSGQKIPGSTHDADKTLMNLMRWVNHNQSLLGLLNLYSPHCFMVAMDRDNVYVRCYEEVEEESVSTYPQHMTLIAGTPKDGLFWFFQKEKPGMIGGKYAPFMAPVRYPDNVRLVKSTPVFSMVFPITEDWEHYLEVDKVKIKFSGEV